MKSLVILVALLCCVLFVQSISEQHAQLNLVLEAKSLIDSLQHPLVKEENEQAAALLKLEQEYKAAATDVNKIAYGMYILICTIIVV
jgi:hypothetical protein